MAKTSAIVTLVDKKGNHIQKTLTDINPDVPNEKLVEFAKKLNGVSENEYESTVRVDKTHCDEEAGGGDTRTVPTLTLSKTSDTLANVQTAFAQNSSGNVYSVPITYNGTAIPYVIASDNTINGFISGSVFKDGANCKLEITGSQNVNLLYPVKFTIGALENEDFKAAEPVTFEITN